VGVLEVWQRNVIVEASGEEEAIEVVLGADNVEQESLFRLRYQPPDTWHVEDTEPEEIFHDALVTIQELKKHLVSVGVPETSSFFHSSDALASRMEAAYLRIVCDGSNIDPV